jgi:hypothetical protein
VSEHPFFRKIERDGSELRRGVEPEVRRSGLIVRRAAAAPSGATSPRSIEPPAAPRAWTIAEVLAARQIERDDYVDSPSSDWRIR